MILQLQIAMALRPQIVTAGTLSYETYPLCITTTTAYVLVVDRAVGYVVHGRLAGGTATASIPLHTVHHASTANHKPTVH